jgi:selenocysteine lyase/cysteine desulfurase
VVTELDHQGNVGPWQAIAKERGVTLRMVPFDPAKGTLVEGALERAMARRRGSWRSARRPTRWAR